MAEKINRRDFLKVLGATGLAGGAAAISGCKNVSSTEGNGEMTCRVNPGTGDKVSLLGYGMMRLPQTGDTADAPIDQEMVNRQIDYALKHGINYFDTSPAYCKGLSEKATGDALKRYDRSSYFIATKLSNFAPETWSREASIEMFENSLKELQTDYVDYLLLHAIGTGSGMKELYSRFIDNGILDYLVEQ